MDRQINHADQYVKFRIDIRWLGCFIILFILNDNNGHCKIFPKIITACTMYEKVVRRQGPKLNFFAPLTNL